jgi:hypothetical protein
VKKTTKKKELAEIQPAELGTVVGGQELNVISVSLANIDTALQVGPR